MRVECSRLFSEDAAAGATLGELRDSLQATLNLPESEFERNTPAALNKAISRKLACGGWAGKVKVPGSNLTVSFMREDVALCVQLGNVARTYADLLKLQTLYKSGRISRGAIVVPVMTAAAVLGSNHASFERLTREIELFQDTITVPLVVVGLGDPPSKGQR